LRLAQDQGGVRWRYVAAKVSGLNLTFYESLRLTSISFFISCVTPFKVGDLSRVYFYKKYRARVMAGVGLEYFFDSLLLFLIPAVLFTIKTKIFLAYIVFILLVSVSLLYLFLRMDFNFLEHSKLSSKVFLTILRTQKNLRDSFKGVLKKPGVIITCFVSSALFYLNYYFCTYLIFRALGLEIDLFSSLKGLSFSQAIGVVSMMPMGLGARELVAMNFFNSDNPILFIGLILSRILIIFPFLIGFYFYMVFPGRRSASTVMNDSDLKIS